MGGCCSKDIEDQTSWSPADPKNGSTTSTIIAQPVDDGVFTRTITTPTVTPATTTAPEFTDTKTVDTMTTATTTTNSESQ